MASNTFNFSVIGGSTQEILPADPQKKNRIKQLNVQNQSLVEMDVNVFLDGNAVYGPIKVASKQLLSLELSNADSNEPWIVYGGKNQNIEVSVSQDALVFGSHDVV